MKLKTEIMTGHFNVKELDKTGVRGDEMDGSRNTRTCENRREGESEEGSGVGTGGPGGGGGGASAPPQYYMRGA